MKQNGIIVHPDELTLRFAELMAEGGLDIAGIHPVGGKHADESCAAAIEWRKLPETKKVWEKLQESGKAVEFELHAMSWLLPRTLFDTHPDWFRMDENGERTPFLNCCPSNPEAMAYLSERARVLGKALHPTDHTYNFWTDDATGGSCHCPKCRGLSPSDQALILNNAMLRGLKQDDPEAKLPYLAYVDTLRVPETVKPEQGIFLEYAPFHRDSERPLFDETCEKNVAEVAHLRELLAFFGTENARVLEYWMDNSRFSGWKKPPKHFHLNRRVLEADAAAYEALGVEVMTCFGCFLGEDYEALYGTPEIPAYGRILRRARNR